MKIGIDARMYRSGVAGIGRYSQNLIKNLLAIDRDDEFVLFMTKEDKKELAFSRPNYFIENCKLKIVICNIPHYSLAEQIKFPKIIENEKLDLMHFLNFNYPVSYKGKFVVTIHDLTLLFYPDTAKRTNFLKQSAFKYTMKKACQNSAQIIAVSENTKKDIIDQFQIPKSKIQIIYEAADDKIFTPVTKTELDHFKQKHHLKTPVILAVGQFRPHKNLPGLIEAFENLRQEIPSKLIILGQPDPKHTRLYEAIDKTKAKNDILMPGFVTDKELALWYRIASVFVFPSLYEGFGLPGLEAMATGTPVVASKQSCLPEIYQNAALYFDPFNSQDIADKIKEVITNKSLRDKLIQNGLQVSRQYSWEKTARETLKLYNNLN